MKKQLEQLEFVFDEESSDWVIKERVMNKQIVTRFQYTKDDWTIITDEGDQMMLYINYIRSEFEEMDTLIKYGLKVLDAWTNVKNSV